MRKTNYLATGFAVTLLAANGNFAAAQEQAGLDAGAGVQSNRNLGIEAPAVSNAAEAQATLDLQGAVGSETQVNPQGAPHAPSAGADANAQLDANAQISADASTQAAAGQNEDWRYREFNGRRWFWQGPRDTGRWTYWDNGRWTEFQAQAGVGSRVSGYRGTANQSYDGPYYFDNTGRRFYQQGSSYLPDENWNNQFWNGDYSNTYRGYWNNYGSVYRGNANGSVGANIGGSVGQTLGGQVGGQVGAGVGAAIQGNGVANGANLGGAVGQALGGQTTGRLGAGVGAAIQGNRAGVGANVGGGVGRVLGGQAGGQVGAGVGSILGGNR